MRSKIDFRNVALITLALIGLMALPIFVVNQSKKLIAPWEPNYYQPDGREALREYRDLVSFVGQTILHDACDDAMPDSMRLLLHYSFDPPQFLSLSKNRLTLTSYRFTDEDGRHRDVVKGGATTRIIAAKDLIRIWERIDDSFMQLPPTNDEFLPIDGYWMSLEICQRGRYAFFTRASPEYSKRDSRLAALETDLVHLAKVDPLGYW